MTHIDEFGEIKPGPFIRSAYNYDMNAASDASALHCPEETLTQQQFAEEVNINTIIKNFGLNGELPENVAVPQSGDFTGVTNFHEAMNIVRKSEEAFMEMPADIRERFSNDPGKFLDFVHDEKNLEEARKMGIARPAPEPAKEAPPTRVIVVPDGGETKPPAATANAVT